MLILALGLVTMVAASGFASVPFLTTSTTNVVAVNAQTGLSGSVLYSPLLAVGQLAQVNAGEIINCQYQAQISYLNDIQVQVKSENFGKTATGFTNVGAAWTAYGTTQTSSTTGVSVTVNAQSIVISFANNVTFVNSDQIRIDGVRLDINALSPVAGGTMYVDLTNSSGQANALNPHLPVAQYSEPLQFGAPFVNPAIPGILGVNTTTNMLSFNAAGVALQGQNLVSVTIGEVFSNGMESRVGGNSQIKITLSNIPTGLTIASLAFAGINGATFSNANTFTPLANPLLVNITGQSSATLQGLQVGITFGLISGTQSLAMNPGAIGVKATLNPPAPTIAATGLPDYPYDNPTTNQGFFYTKLQYKYAVREISTSITVNVTALTSNLLSIFNMLAKDTANPGEYIYDTGFAIVNTSGSGSIPAGIAGTITVSLYPADGSGPKSFTTGSDAATRPGLGLSSTGALPPKGTWVVMLRQLLAPAGYSSTAETFRGFIRFQCNFQGAAGINYIADGDFLVTSQGYVMVSDVPSPMILNVNQTTGAGTGTFIPGYF